MGLAPLSSQVWIRLLCHVAGPPALGTPYHLTRIVVTHACRILTFLCTFRQNGNCGKSRIQPELARTVADTAPQIFDGWKGAHFFTILLQKYEIAELAPCGRSGIRGRHSLTNIPFLKHAQVRLHLLIEFAVRFVAREQPFKFLDEDPKP